MGVEKNLKYNEIIMTLVLGIRQLDQIRAWDQVQSRVNLEEDSAAPGLLLISSHQASSLC
jgi:hypothetical protein